MRHWITLVESLGTPDWFQAGQIVDILDPRWDAAEYLENDEFDYEWRLCDVPMEVLTPRLANFQPLATATQTADERVTEIRQWYERHGCEAALRERPILMVWNGNADILDGYHRALLAKTEGLRHVPALVGVNQLTESPMNDPLEQYVRFLNDGTKHQFGGETMIEKRDDDLAWLAIEKNGSIVAILGVLLGDPYPCVDLAIVSPEVRDRGMMRCLLTFWVKTYGPLLSSGRQTDHARWMWKALAKHQGNLNLFVYNSATAEKHRWTGDDSPWDDTEETRILIEDKGMRIRRYIHEKYDMPVYEWWGSVCSPGASNP